MRYLGGKSRLARHLSEAMLADTDTRTDYVEPFMGGASVLAAMAPHFERVLAADIQPLPVVYWRAVAQGWLPADTVTYDDWVTLRAAARAGGVSPDIAHAAFNASFGGKEWGGYARAGKSNRPQNFADEGRRRAARYAPAIEGVEFRVADYLDVFAATPDGAVVYCDPPYRGTTAYRTAPFDAEEFDAACRSLASRATVYVSEFSVGTPADVVWSRDRAVQAGGGADTRARTTEKLFRILP